MHPRLDLFDEIVRALGWPTLLGTIVWIVRKWDKGQEEFKKMGENTKEAVRLVTAVKAQTEVIETNHLQHLQEGITRLAGSNDKAVEILLAMDKSLAIMADRSPRTPRA